MAHYLDTSALVKAYVQEEGTGTVVQLLRFARNDPEREAVYTSEIAYPEAVSAVTRRESRGEISAAETELFVVQIRAHFTGRGSQPFNVVEVNSPLIEHAAELVRTHRLRAFDAMHLATAIAVRDARPAGAPLGFCVADRRLASAAAAEGFALVELV